MHCVHYSFDYAQQVHYLSDPQQPGPIFFLISRKCSIFGIHCEAIPRQVNVLGVEAGGCGKGANVVISQLHYYFDHHGLGEKEVYLHADNCTGQNKNSCMLCWRCMTKRHTKATLSFLIVGHTKLSPDWCFGQIKQLYKRPKSPELLTSLLSAVFPSSSLERTGLQLCRFTAGHLFFAMRMKKLPGFKKLHHFRFESAKPGNIMNKWDGSRAAERAMDTEPSRTARYRASEMTMQSVSGSGRKSALSAHWMLVM